MNAPRAIRRPESYEGDFHACSADQANRIRQARPRGIDWENIAEEIESLGRSDRRALGSGLKIALDHLPKWRFQPDKRTASRSDSIEEHRDRIARIIEDSPSLAGVPAEMLGREHGRARRKVLRDTKLPAKSIPETCPFTVGEALDADFRPGNEPR